MIEGRSRWLLFAVGLFGSGMLLASILYFAFPQWILAAVEKGYESNAGVTEKKLRIQGYTTTYYEGGKGPTLVLIHGFGDSKISFLRTAKWLTPHFRVILPEVPGFGRSKQDPKRSYSIAAQVKHFHAFFQALKLQSFILGGNSMGGHISAAYTLKYPQHVRKLILLNAAGLYTPKAIQPYKSGRGTIQTPEDFSMFVRRLFYTIPPIPRSVRNYLAQEAVRNEQWNHRVARDIRMGQDYTLNHKVHRIHTPTLIVWGDHDRIVLPPVGELYHAKIKHSKWVMMKKCGHLPHNERPYETALHLLKFLRK